MPTLEVQDVSLEYFQQGPESSVPVVLIHGAGSSARIWDSVQTYLAESGYQSYAISLRGAGGSDRTRESTDYHPSSYAIDLRGALDKLGITKCVLVGHSLGTIVASYILRDAPDLVERLIQIAGPAVLKEPNRSSMTSKTRAGYGKSLSPEAFAHWEAQHLGLSEDIRKQLRTDIDNNPEERLLGQARPWDGITDVAATIQVPTLVILGDADDVVDPAEPLDYFLQLNESVRHLHVFSGVGHYPNAQVPERLVGVFKRFITS